MYSIYTANNKTEKRLNEYISSRQDIKEKLNKLKVDPRREIGAHQLHGKLQGKWACWLGSNIRMIYIIDDKNQSIIVLAVGSHKVY
jgi:addiction module RelE/StbE family toxin